MSNRYNLFYFEAEFKKYLIAVNSESSTVKNYLSDLHFFFSWVMQSQSIRDLAYSDIPDVFSHSLIHSYYTYLESATKSDKTISRRISTLRKFFHFCIEQHWIVENPVNKFDAHNKRDERKEVLSAYKQYLQTNKYSTGDLDRHINVIKTLIINSNIL